MILGYNSRRICAAVGVKVAACEMLSLPSPKTHGRRPRFFSVVLCASALLFTTNSVSAQTTSLGTIAGTITDQTNAVISGAAVTIKDTATRAVRTTSSNYAGQYVFVNVHPGTYDITIFKPSFSKVSIPHDLVQLGPLSTHNVILRVGSDSQTLEVAATGVELQSDNATVGNRVPGSCTQRIAQHRARYKHLHNATAGDYTGWQCRRRCSGPELIPTRRWRQHKRHGRHYGYL